MRPRLLTALLLWWALAAQAGVELNSATVAELDSIKGIGPALSRRMLEERQKAPFADWADFIARVRGVGRQAAARWSAAGLTVNGQPFADHPAPAER